MNSELINALISQIGNIVGIPLAAVLAVWQVMKGFTSKRNDEVNEKSFGLCCELFDLVSRNESYNCAYVSNEDNRLRKALGYPRDTLYSFHVLRYGSEGPFKLFVHLMVAVLFVLFEILICFVVSLGTSWLIGIGSLIGSAALVGLVIEIWRFWKNKSPNSFWRFVKEQKRKIKEEEKENT